MSDRTATVRDDTRADRSVMPSAGRTQLFGSLCVLVFLVNLGRVIYAPLLEPFRVSFEATAGAVGLLATLAWIGSATFQLPTGYLLTKVPRHHLILTAGLVLAASSAFAATAQSLPMLSVGALCMGLASGIYFVAANPLVSELYPEGVGRAIGIHGMASQLAAVAAPALVSGFLALTWLWPVASWRVLFVAIAVVTLCSTAILTVTARRATLPTAGQADRDFLGALRRQWPIIVTGVALIGVAGLVWNGVFNFYVTYLVETKGLGEGRSRSYLTVLFLTGVPAFVITGWIADRVRLLPLLFAIVGGFVVSVLAITAVSSPLAVLVVTAVMGYVVHSLFPAIDTYLLASVPDENRASAYALFSGVVMPIQATGSAILGTLVDAGMAFDEAFRLFAAVTAVVLVAMMVLYAADRLPTGRKLGDTHG